MSSPAAVNIDVKKLQALHLQMWRIRAFEEMALRAVHDGFVLGPIHLYVGEEAIATGVCAHLRQDDIILSTHRGHGHTLAKGAKSLAMMRELLGREGGNCGGKGGSMHIADFGVGMLGANGVVAANIVIAAGAAHAVKLKGEDKVVACMFGDGAINRGPFLEGLNWAQSFGLPVLFVCEDNNFAAMTRTKVVTGGEGASARARSIGLRAVEVDGNDVLEVESTARELIDDVRRGKGPVLLHAHTYRLTGHTGTDPASYRPREEVEQRWLGDPIARAAAMLAHAGIGQPVLEEARATAFREMEAAYATAQEAPFPAISSAFDDVQDIGNPRELAF